MAEKDDWVGLGSAVERVARRLGIPTCAGCRRRRDALNRAVPRVFRSDNAGATLVLGRSRQDPAPAPADE